MCFHKRIDCQNRTVASVWTGQLLQFGVIEINTVINIWETDEGINHRIEQIAKHRAVESRAARVSLPEEVGRHHWTTPARSGLASIRIVANAELSAR